MAFGCPVRLNGPAPGRPICRVAKCRLISAELFALPEVDWFRPWHQSDRTAPDSANQRAAVVRSACSMPHSAATLAGG